MYKVGRQAHLGPWVIPAGQEVINTIFRGDTFPD